MPIRAQFRWLYPIDWPQLSDTVRFKRAGGCCERCGRPHGQQIVHLGDGRWWDAKRERWRDGAGRLLRLPPLARFAAQNLRQTQVYLATAHLDHDPTNNRAGNLAALCQRCHMLHDGAEHRRQRWLTRHRRRALGDLFSGPYPRLG